MRYEKYNKEIEELEDTPLPLGEEWVEIRVRSAKQYKMCLEHGIKITERYMSLPNGERKCFASIHVKFEDIINLFD